ncbi:hypothetical protein K491DRAFT_679934 [Lophiostoma macrostomum CBS 122681]|uniref:Uncharacterized protein n=1 Tax=Lophiostoma macrostomum CBS 122681 TaxID=1314788 RepID=A0A6A6T5L5_9PLEO|nr:hypothetical protein K491DRAFT_679934 [Lophiostoma macrostomum CBS 122681]
MVKNNGSRNRRNTSAGPPRLMPSFQTPDLGAGTGDDNFGGLGDNRDNPFEALQGLSSAPRDHQQHQGLTQPGETSSRTHPALQAHVAAHDGASTSQNGSSRGKQKGPEEPEESATMPSPQINTRRTVGGHDEGPGGTISRQGSSSGAGSDKFEKVVPKKTRKRRRRTKSSQRPSDSPPGPRIPPPNTANANISETGNETWIGCPPSALTQTSSSVPSTPNNGGAVKKTQVEEKKDEEGQTRKPQETNISTETPLPGPAAAPQKPKLDLHIKLLNPPRFDDQPKPPEHSKTETQAPAAYSTALVRIPAAARGSTIQSIPGSNNESVISLVNGNDDLQDLLADFKKKVAWAHPKHWPCNCALQAKMKTTLARLKTNRDFQGIHVVEKMLAVMSAYHVLGENLDALVEAESLLN